MNGPWGAPAHIPFTSGCERYHSSRSRTSGLDGRPLRRCSLAAQCQSPWGASGKSKASTRAAGAQKRQCRPQNCYIAPHLRLRTRQRAGAAGSVPHLALQHCSRLWRSLLSAAPTPNTVLEPPQFLLLGAWKFDPAAARKCGALEAAEFCAAHCDVRLTAPPREQAGAAKPLQPFVLL